MPRKLSDYVIKTTLILAKDFTPLEIGRQLGVEPRRVRYILQKHNIKPLKQNTIWLDLFEDAKKMSVANLSKKYNYPKRTIYRKLVQNNIKPFCAKHDK